MDSTGLFEAWRLTRSPHDHWGLAWFLANQFCRRFYSSHGIVPHVIERDGIGYYGITLSLVPCLVNGPQSKDLGRLTKRGDVENWRTGGPGDHGLATSALCRQGLSTDELVRQAIRHMDLPVLPAKSHVSCRHKRWGGSYVLVFEIATVIALRCGEDVEIWNAPYHTADLIRQMDPHSAMPEHPGAFIFVCGEQKVIVSGDGRLLDGSGRNLWTEHMQGESTFKLALSIERLLRPTS